MKKKLSLLLITLLSLSLISCGSKDSGANVSQTSGESTLETSAEISNESTLEASPETSNSTSEATSEGSSNDTSSETSSVSETVEEAFDPATLELYIKDIFAEHNMKAGTCVTRSMIKDPDQSAIILSQFNSLTMENAMKPDYILDKEASIKSGDLVVSFNGEVKAVLNFAKENGLSMRGHTLVWHSQTPSWIFYNDFDTSKGLASRDVMLKRLESYIKQVFEQLTDLGYIDLFYAYDVVNEAWMEDGSMRDSKWKTTIGDDYIWYAFYFADKYAPESIDLYYNDYNEQYKTSTLIKFVQTLVDEDGRYLIDGVGFQAHLYTSDSLVTYFNTMDKVADLGLKIQLTELDVCLGAYQKQLLATDENLKLQGQFYYDLINGIFERVDNNKVNMDALTFWGFSDNLSWRKEYSPLMYNKKLQKKYAYYGIMQLKEYAGFDE